MAESHTFSVGVDDLLLQIRPYGKKESNFPPGYDEPEARRRTQETLREWFVRVVDQFCHSDPKRAAIEDNIAVFIRLGWRDRQQLVYAIPWVFP